MVFKSEDLAYSRGYEERTYSFENGKLYKRRIQINSDNDYMDETIYLDTQQQLSAMDKIMTKPKEKTLQWNDLYFRAHPESKPAPTVNVKAILQEANDVLTIIAPAFN